MLPFSPRVINVSSFLGTLRVIKRALEMEHLSLCRGCVRGTWRGCFFSEDFERYVKRALD
jgi:hypothetical protein